MAPPAKVALDDAQPSSARFGLTDLLLLGAITAWGSFPILGKLALAHIPALVFVPLRMWLATGGLFVYAAATRQSLRIHRQEWGRLLLVGILGWSINQILYMLGLPLTTAGHTGLMVATTPIFAAITARALGLETLERSQVAGILLCLVSVGWLQRQTVGLAWLPDAWLGDLLILGSAATDGIRVALVTSLLRRYGATRIITWCTLINAVSLTPIAVIPARELSWAAIPPSAWAIVLWTSLVNVVLANIAWHIGIRRIGSVRTTVYQYIQPILSIILGVILLNERYPLSSAPPSLLLLLGVFLVRWPRAQRGNGHRVS